MKRLWVFLAVAAVVGLVAGAGYWGFVSNQPPAAEAPTAPLTVTAATCDVQQTVTAPGSLVNTRTVKLEMPAAGRLAEVLVRAGETVSAGQILARLADPEKYAAARAAAELELAQAEQALAEIYANAPLVAAQARLAVLEAQQVVTASQRSLNSVLHPVGAALLDGVEDARVALDTAKANQQLGQVSPEASALQDQIFVTSWYKHRLDEAQTKYDETPRQDTLEELQKAQSQYLAELNKQLTLQLRIDTERENLANNVRNAQAAYDQTLASLQSAQSGPNAALLARYQAESEMAHVKLEQAEAELAARQSGPDPNAVAAAQARVDKAAAVLTEAEHVVEQIEVRAPFAGVVLEVNARLGETLPAAAALFTLADPQAVEVEATVIEEDVPYVSTGQAADIYFDAWPSDVITGTVTAIVPQRLAGDRPLYHVYLALSRVPAALFAGMSADAAVVIAERQGVLCLPRALAQASADGTASVEVWTGSAIQKRTLTIGLRGDTYVEVLSGLQAGEAVVAR